MEFWSEYWCLPLSMSKCEGSFSINPHQANLQPDLLLFNSLLRFNPTSTFLGVTFDRTFFFSKHVSSLKAKFFAGLKALRCISASSWGPSKEALSLLYKAFIWPLITYVSLGWFPFVSATDITKLEHLHRAASRAITGCLSSLIPLLLSEDSLPSLQVTLTHFALSFYERKLCLPTFFPISNLARHEMKLRLCRSSWRAFTSTHLLMLSSTSPKKALLAWPLFPSWNLLFSTVESTLLFPCSRSNPLFLAKMRLSLTLTLSHFTTWYSGQTALFLFLLAKAALAYLPTAFSMALRPLFPFQQAQYAKVFLLKPASLSKLFAGLGSTNKSATFLLFSSYMTIVLFSSLCSLLCLSCYLNLSGRNCLLSLPVLSGYNGSPGHLLLLRNDAAVELTRRGVLLMSSAILCSFFPLISRIHSSLFSDWRRTVSSNFFNTQVPLISTEELVLPRHACCVLFCLRCNKHSLLLSSYLSRIGRIENPFCNTCGHSFQDTTYLILHCPATDSLRRSLFGNSLSLYDLWSRPWGVSRFLVLHGLPPCPHSSKGVGYQQHRTKTELANGPFALCLA